MRPDSSRCVDMPLLRAATIADPLLIHFATACGNCNKYGANCPGYNKSLKFITGKHAVHSQKGRRGQVRGCGTQLNLRSTSPAGTDSAPAGPAVSTTQALSPFAADVSKYGLHSQDARRPGIPLRLREDCTPFVYNMMGQLFSIHARDEVVFSKSYSHAQSGPPTRWDRLLFLNCNLCAVVERVCGVNGHPQAHLGLHPCYISSAGWTCSTRPCLPSCSSLWERPRETPRISVGAVISTAGHSGPCRRLSIIRLLGRRRRRWPLQFCVASLRWAVNVAFLFFFRSCRELT